MKKTVCPFCGSPNVEYMGEEYRPNAFHCHCCDLWFEHDDVEYEDLRHKISALLTDTDEQHPLLCDIPVGEEEACGLSSLELPRIGKMFQVPGDGTIYYHILGHLDNDSGEEAWMELDTLPLTDLRELYKSLSEG